jgi:hypothetical protein
MILPLISDCLFVQQIDFFPEPMSGHVENLRCKGVVENTQLSTGSSPFHHLQRDILEAINQMQPHGELFKAVSNSAAGYNP